MKPDTNPAPAYGALQAGQPPAFPLAPGSQCTTTDGLNVYTFTGHPLMVRADEHNREVSRLRSELTYIVDFDCGHWAAGKHENEAIRMGYQALKQIAADALANNLGDTPRQSPKVVSSAWLGA